MSKKIWEFGALSIIFAFFVQSKTFSIIYAPFLKDCMSFMKASIKFLRLGKHKFSQENPISNSKVFRTNILNIHESFSYLYFLLKESIKENLSALTQLSFTIFSKPCRKRSFFCKHKNAIWDKNPANFPLLKCHWL